MSDRSQFVTCRPLHPRLPKEPNPIEVFENEGGRTLGPGAANPLGSPPESPPLQG